MLRCLHVEMRPCEDDPGSCGPVSCVRSAVIWLAAIRPATIRLAVIWLAAIRPCLASHDPASCDPMLRPASHGLGSCYPASCDGPAVIRMAVIRSIVIRLIVNRSAAIWLAVIWPAAIRLAVIWPIAIRLAVILPCACSG